MAELTESSTAEIIAELIEREDFAGCVLSVTLGEGATRDDVAAQFTPSLDEGPSHRRHEILTRAILRLEKP